MTDATLGGFVANGVIAQGGATTRLAQAFQALVPDNDRRPGLLEIARSAGRRVAARARPTGFVDLWKNAADMLTSYSDEQFVSEDYARELSGARTQALEVERVSDDPPERIGSWVDVGGRRRGAGAGSAAAARSADHRNGSGTLARRDDPGVSHIEDLLLVGDFEGALQLTSIADDTKRPATATASRPRRPRWRGSPKASMMTHVVTHLRSVDDDGRRAAASSCVTWSGRRSSNRSPKRSPSRSATVARQRFTQILLGFGAAGNNAVEQLRASANPAVRRTAIHLLREFGGSDALPDLTALLDDTEPHVQREAVRAILSIGTEEAYAELQRALATGTNQTREALTTAPWSPCGASARFRSSSTSSGRSIARGRFAPSTCARSSRLER